MKKLSAILFALCCIAPTVLAADIIVTRNTAEIEVKIIEVTATHIRYKSWKDKNGQTFTFPLELVAKIRYDDGRVVDLNTIEHEDFAGRDIYGDGTVSPDATTTEYIARDGSLVRETTIYRKTDTYNADSVAAALKLKEEQEKAAKMAAEQKRQAEIAAAKRAKQVAKIQELVALSEKQKKYSTIDFAMGGTLFAGGIAGLACAPFVKNQPASLICGGALCGVGALGMVVGCVDLKKSKKNAAAAAKAQSKLDAKTTASATLTLQLTTSANGVGLCLNL